MIGWLILAWLACGALGYILDRRESRENKDPDMLVSTDGEPIPAWSEFDRRWGLVHILKGPLYLLASWASRGDMDTEARW